MSFQLKDVFTTEWVFFQQFNSLLNKAMFSTCVSSVVL